MPSLWLALVLFQLASAVPTSPDAAAGAPHLRDAAPLTGKRNLHVRDDVDWSPGTPWRGTNVNAKSVGKLGPDHRAGQDFLGDLKNPSAQPTLPRSFCNYEYQPSDKAVVFEPTGHPVTDLDVAQGGIGDCGLGASVAAVAVTGHAQYLKDRLNIRDRSFEFKFSINGTDTLVAVDGQLPTLTGNNPPKCLPYLGFQISGTNNNTAYVPYLEKAVAKYLLAFPAAKSIEETRGYLTLEGIWPDIALELITGAKGRRVFREKPGLDEGILKALDRCLTQNEPCVLGSPWTGEPWDSFGDNHNGTTFPLPFGANYTSATLVVDKELDQFVVTDYDYETGKNTTNTIVPSHAWAIDKHKSEYDPNNLRESKIRVLNPWGENLKPWTEQDAPNALELSLPALASIFDAVFTVESLP